MASLTSPARVETKVLELKERLQKCWNLTLNWKLYPKHFKEGCEQIGKTIDMPADSVLSGILLLTSFCQSHCVIKVPETTWIEPGILWIAIAMPTGSGKTPLFIFLTNILIKVRSKLKLSKSSPPWLLDEACFEMLGDLMASNHSKLLGMYDELSTFLAQLNIYRGKGLCDSHDLSTFLSLYNGKSWSRSTVSGDANFCMDRTALSVGGFTQPTVAKALIGLPASIEKGFTQRFLWIFPQPSFAKFESLELANEKFCDYLVDKLASVWRASANDVKVVSIPENCKTFTDYYDCLQDKISQLSVVDELLTGMLSKAKGQVLRVSAALNVFFSDFINEERNIVVSGVPDIITDDAILAAEDFVDTCCQHAAFIAGRGKMDDEVQQLNDKCGPESVLSLPAYCLLLPGKQLFLSALLAAKKFRNKGNKTAAVAALEELEKAGLGKLQIQDSRRGTSAVYTFIKLVVDDNNMEEMVMKLAKYGISIQQYQRAMQLPEISPPVVPISRSIIGTKRTQSSTPPPPPRVRRSPRKLYTNRMEEKKGDSEEKKDDSEEKKDDSEEKKDNSEEKKDNSDSDE